MWFGTAAADAPPFQGSGSLRGDMAGEILRNPGALRRAMIGLPRWGAVAHLKVGMTSMPQRASHLR